MLLLDISEKMKWSVCWTFSVRSLRSHGKRSEGFSVSVSAAQFLEADVEFVAFDVGDTCLSLNYSSASLAFLLVPVVT